MTAGMWSLAEGRTNEVLVAVRRGSKDVDDLDRENSLRENYAIHDIGEAHFRARIRDAGIVPEAWGIDKRDDDGEKVLYDDKLDLRLRDEDGDLAGLAEIKTKTNEDWFGIINRRHYRKYVEKAYEIGVPTYIWMGYVEEDPDDFDQPVVQRQACIEIEPWEEFVDVMEGNHPHFDAGAADEYLKRNALKSPIVDYAFRAPDGNVVVEFDEESFCDWSEMTARVASDSIVEACERRSRPDHEHDHDR